MRRTVYRLLILLCALPIFVSIAQDEVRFTIAVLEDGRVNSAGYDETRDVSLSHLIDTLSRDDIQVITTDLRTSLSSQDVDLLLIVRPQGRMRAIQIAHFWSYIYHGGNLLLAIDPNGHNRTNTEDEGDGVAELLDLRYGIQFWNDILIEPWADKFTLSEINSSWGNVHPNPTDPHPIVQPLVDYDLPVRYWGGRSLRIDAVNGYAQTDMLLYTETAYGDVSRVNLSSDDLPNEPNFELNIGDDFQGRLLLAGIAESLETASRVAVVTDGELFLNQYGLAYHADTTTPIHAGNYLFAQRLLQWLLHIPQEEWQPLPSDILLIGIDGQGGDWDAQNLPSPMFHTDYFAYLALETDVADETPISLVFDTETVVLADGRVMVDDEPVYDADYAISDLLEVRLPLRLVGDTPILSELCTNDSDCETLAVSSTPLELPDPLPVRFDNVPSALTLNNASLQVAPFGDVITTLPEQMPFALLGQNEVGDWLYIANGRYAGWVIADAMMVNGRTEAIVESGE